MAVKSQLKGLILSSLLLLCAASVDAQPQLGDLISRVKRAVVIVNTYDETGKPLTHMSGFFIAPDRVLTSLRFIDTAPEIRINTFSGRTISAPSVIARYRDADLAILQLSQPCLDLTPLKVKKISLPNGSTVILDNSKQAEWRVTPEQSDGGWTFDHIATHLQITASLGETSGGGPVVKLKGHMNGTAVSVP